VSLLFVIGAGVCFLLAALSAFIPIPHPLPVMALGLLFQLVSGHVPASVRAP
jgi:hypothetical protein